VGFAIEKPLKDIHMEKEEPQTDQDITQGDMEGMKADQGTPKRTLRSLVNTPLKKVMFGVQILSYILIVGSPLIGGAIGRSLDLKPGQTAGVILGVFIAGEILFYGSLAFLGRELLLLLRDRVKGWFKSRKPVD
jgi:hypothetical protein